MRNLKRALSLALASVMVMGLMVVGSGASYVDVSSKNNVEAIEVLQAVGIMTGDENGKFNPDAKVTRNEMAVIMCNLLDYTVASYKGTAPFTDVPAWAEPYVAACYTNSIIAGYSATTFGGNDGVTTAQAALMLLKALGYFQYQNDFGEDWIVSTISQGSKADLFDGVDTGATATLTRNDVAQMVLNALEADVVDATGGGGVTVEGDGFTVSTGKAVYESRTSSATKYAKIDATKTSDGKNIIQLGEDLYNGDLEKKAGNGDDFGRPANTWKYKSDEIGTYSDEADYTYANKVTKGTLYSDVGKSIVNNIGDEEGEYTLTVYVDGEEVTADVDDLFKSGSSAHIDDEDGNPLTGNGVQTEVYIDEDKNTIDICIIKTYVMQATNDYSESKESLNVDVLSGGNKDTTLDLEDFDTLADYEEDDYILYTYAKGEVQSIAKAEVITGEVSSVTKNSVTIDGTKYSYAKVRADDTAEGGEDGMTRFTADESASIVVDAYGYLIWIDDASLSTGSYVYVSDAETASLGKTAKAGLYTTDGVYEEAVVKKVKDSAGDSTTDAEEIVDILTTESAWYSYTKDSSGRYTLTATKTNETATIESKTDASVDVIVGESVKFLPSDSSIRGNNSTVFIVDDGDDVNVYTGINNAPTVTLAKTDTAGDKKATVSYLRVDDKDSKTYALVVFVDAGKASVDESTTATEIMYVAKLDSTYKDSSDTVYVYKVFMDGKEQTVEAIDKLDVGEMYYKVQRDSDDRITDSSKLFTDATGGEYRTDDLTKAVVDYSDGALTLGDEAFTVTDDAEIVLVLMKGAGDVMDDDDADYELGATSARGVYNVLKNYKVTGSYYGITTESDNDELETLYVIVTATEAAK